MAEEDHGFACNLRDIYPTPDTVTVSFAFESGVVGSGTWAYTSGAELDEMEFIGTAGNITFAVSAPTPFTVVDDDGARSFDMGPSGCISRWSSRSSPRSRRRPVFEHGSSAHAAWFADEVLEVLVLVNLLDVGSDRAYSHEMRRNL